MNQSNGDDLKTPKEISLGIIGNLACYEALLKHIVSTNGLIEIVVDQLFLEDSQCLCEACWLLTLGIQSSECITWAKALQSEHVIYHILWIVENTLNLQLIEKVVFDAPNGVISTMKPGANWVVMHLSKWMYVLYGVRNILEGWGVLYVEVHEERMHHNILEGWGVLYVEVHEERMHHLFLNDTSICHGPGLLVGKWHFFIYLLLEDN